MKYLSKGFALTTLALLSACGGSDSGTPPEVTPPAEVTPPDEVFRVQENPFDASILALSTIESFLQVGSLANDILSSAIFADNGVEKSCGNGGLMTKTFDDNDNSNNLSNSDVINVQYRDCYVSALDSTINGAVELVLTSTDDDLIETSGKIKLSNIIFDADNELKLQGVIQFESKRLPMSNLTSVKNIGLVTLTINQNAEQQVNFIDSSFTRLEQFSNATYSISGLGTLDIPSLDINYSFKVVDPLSGHFGEYPHEGKVEAFTSESDIIQISSNFVNNSDAFNIKVGSEIYSEYWSQAVEGSLWSFSNGHTNYVKNYRSDNFDFVGVLDTDKLSSFPVSGGSIRALMSRTIKKEEYGTTIYFQTDDWPYTQIPAEITTSGAILYLTPQSPLSAGRTYNINSFEVTSEKEVTSWVPYINNIVVNDSLIMNYDIGTELYKENDYPILDASASIMNEGTALKFTWVDINNIGITFSDKNSAVTSFTAPEKYTEDVFIRLILSNSQGYEVHSDIKLSYFTPSSTMMHFVSPLGDYVGAGQTLTMNSSDALFTISRNGWDNEDHIGVRVDGNTWWTLDIAAPKGQQLTTKRYENATRYPFQAPLAPGLDFNGDHRGCSSVLGEFEIIELTYDADNQVEKLAVNFQQSCEQTSPVLKGLIRYNSSAKLN